MRFLLPLFALSCFAASATAAENVALTLKANGAVIQGESFQTSLGRANSIECLSFEQSVSTPRDAASGLATGKRQYEPIRLLKRIDKSSPLLFKALVNNEVIEGTFRFFRPNPAGDGTTENFYEIQIKGGRLNSIKQIVPDTQDKNSADLAPLEEVELSFQSIQWTYNNGGVSFADNDVKMAPSSASAKSVVIGRPPVLIPR